MKAIEGRVLEIYDGATYTQIEVVAGQYSGILINNETDHFVVHRDSYSRGYNWGEIAFVPNHHDLGHTAYFIWSCQ